MCNKRLFIKNEYSRDQEERPHWERQLGKHLVFQSNTAEGVTGASSPDILLHDHICWEPRDATSGREIVCFHVPCKPLNK